MTGGISRSALAKAQRAEAAFRRRLQLSRVGLALVGLALAFVAIASTALAAVGDDVVEHNGFTRGDASELHTIVTWRSGGLDTLAKFATFVGSVGVVIVLGVVASVVLWRLGAAVVVALSPLVALVAAGMVAAVLKGLVGRTRPPVRLHLVAESSPSFPSGHATDSAALFVALAIVVAAVFAHRRWSRILIVAAGVAATAAIGTSRLILGVHWPTDVFAGWALGSIAAVTVTTCALLFVHCAPSAGAAPRGRVARIGALLASRRPSHTSLAA